MRARCSLLVLLAAATLSVAAPAAGRSGPPCAPDGIDAQAVRAARAAIDVACDCSGFASHARYERCVHEAVKAAVRNGLRPPCRNTLRTMARRSSCSFRRPMVVCCELTRDGRDVCNVKGTRKCKSKGRRISTPCPGVAFCSDAACSGGTCAATITSTTTSTTTTTAPPTCARGVLYGGEGNRLRRFDIDTIKTPPLVEDVLIPSAADDPNGRDMNGQICPFPDGSGRFIAGEDTGQPHPPQGWGVFEGDGTQVGKLTPTYQGGPDNAENFGCGFDAQGRLFTTDVGNQGFGSGTGQLIVWFPPFDRFPGPPGAYPNTDEQSTNYCIIAHDIATAGSLAIDEQGRVYVTAASAFRVLRFSPPFPTSPDAAGGCGATDPNGSPMADTVNREQFVFGGIVGTPTGIARARNGNWFIGGVLNGVIAEYTPSGQFVRRVLEPPAGEVPPEVSTGNPQGLAVDCEGDLYYADLALRVGPGGGIGPGPNGKVRWIHFDAAGNPQPPVVVKEGLAFPDAVAVLPGDLEGP
jgi:hypothetical protein